MTRIKRTIRPLSAQAIIALGFLCVIFSLALLLMLPVSSQSGQWTDPISALFTATSAVCVTGLVVVDTATYWSLFGKIAILSGIQIGGLGVMTMLSLLSLLLGRRIGLRQRTLLLESISGMQLGGIVRLVRRTLIGTLIIEGVGAALLSLVFVPLLGPIRGIGYAVFHAVSAFCNAGFDLMGSVTGPYTSLESFVGQPIVNLTVMALILVGGLGFLVWDDLIGCRFRFKRLCLHSRVVLLLLAFLVIAPAAVFFFIEANASMAGLSLQERILASLFSAVTPRTAGFDTVPTGSLSQAGQLLTMLLMLTGGNPGSTAGGVKTTTMLVVLLVAASILRREQDLHLLGRRIGRETMRRACSILIVYLTAAFLAMMVICAAQQELALGDVMLEVLSALNTVGMSTGVTRQLTSLPRLTLILLMYAGRLGSLTLALLIMPSGKTAAIRRPEGRVLVG